MTHVNTLAKPGLVISESGPERSFGVRRAAVDGDDIVSAMASGQWLLGPAGVAPGGSLGVLIDVVLGFAMIRDRPAGLWSVSTEISLDLCAPVPVDGSPLVCQGRLAADDAKGAIAAGTVTDESGRLIALCRQHGRWVTVAPEVSPSILGAASPAVDDSVDYSADACAETWEPSTAPDLATFLGTRVELTEGGATAELEVTKDVTNPMGNLHGGVTFAACDLAAQAALGALGGGGGPVQTASIHVIYPRPMPLGTAPRFEARVIHRGRGMGIVGVRVTTDGAKPCAIATITTSVPA